MTNPKEPAFPRSYTADGHNGMTLRDYYAGQALPVMLSQLYAMAQHQKRQIDDMYKIASLASYEVADAMLAAREEEQ